MPDGDEFGMSLLEDSDPFDTVHSRQANIRKNQIGQLMTNLFERFFHRAIAAAARISVGTIDEKSQTLADLALVFDNRHLDARGQLVSSYVLRRVGFVGH